MINLKKMGKKLFSSIIATAIAGLIITVPVKADTTADANALALQQALLFQQQQQALLAQQQQQAELLKQYQAAIAKQQAELLKQQQALLAQQYQAALQVQANFINQHDATAQQAFLLQQTQFLQYQQYQAMIQRCGLDYQSQLLSEYQKYQNAALTSFLGYNGY